MSTKPLKLLAVGDVEGNFQQLFTRIKKIQDKSGSFDLLLCVGDFFGDKEEEWKQYESGEKKVPVSTLILGPNKSEHCAYYQNRLKDGCELCENVTYLGTKGLFTGSSGLQIAYLSGTQGAHDARDDTHFSEDDITSLTTPVTANSTFKGVDILLTSQWPKGVTKYSIEPDDVDTKTIGSELISTLCLRLKPRYHFSALEDVFYERTPYRNHKVLQESARHVTRFISLAKVGNKQKKKYIYAFSITPLKLMDQDELTKPPADCTECPYPDSLLTQAEARKEISEKEGAVQFFYDMKSGEKSKQSGRKRYYDQDGSPQQNKKKKQPQPTGPCWFCLGSPEVEKHLVVSVGMQCYLALAKGGLVSDHVLILPIGHHQSTVLADSDVIEEVEKYKSSLKKYFKSQGKIVVFFERNYRTQHLQIQVVPLAQHMVQDLKETFMECAEENSLELAEIPKHTDLKQVIPVGVPYFYVELPTGDKLLHRISKNFPLQFGREALASVTLLNIPEKVDWKNCSVGKDEETEIAAEFKSNFKLFDFYFS